MKTNTTSQILRGHASLASIPDRSRLRRPAAGFIAAAFSVCLALAGDAANLTVTNLADDGPGSRMRGRISPATLSGANTTNPTFTAPTVAPGGETLSFELTVTANGDTAIDAVINGDGTVLLRAERSGQGDGRVYRVHFTASNPDGSIPGMVKVPVPMKKKTDAAIDSGATYDSTH